MENIFYPKWLYHPKKKPVIVESQEEQEKLGSKWVETPFENTEVVQEGDEGSDE